MITTFKDDLRFNPYFYGSGVDGSKTIRGDVELPNYKMWMFNNLEIRKGANLTFKSVTGTVFVKGYLFIEGSLHMDGKAVRDASIPIAYGGKSNGTGGKVVDLSALDYYRNVSQGIMYEGMHGCPGEGSVDSGYGGGRLRVFARKIVLTCTGNISADGVDGQEENGVLVGGGSGGFVEVYCDSIDNKGYIHANGGKGANSVSVAGSDWGHSCIDDENNRISVPTDGADVVGAAGGGAGGRCFVFERNKRI